MFFLGARNSNPGEESEFGLNQAQARSRWDDLRVIRYSVVMILAVIIAVIMGIRIGMTRQDPSLRLASAPQLKDVEPERNAAIDAAVVAADDAISPDDRILRTFLGKLLAAKKWTDFLPLVRNPNVAGPRMDAYYQVHPVQAYDDVVISTKATKVGKLIVLTLTGKNIPNHRLVLEKQGDDYKVDWEAFVIWQQAPWKSLTTGERVIRTEIRCLAKPVPNNHPSFRQDGWMAYELFNPVTKEILYGYLEKQADLPEGSPRAILTSGAAGPCTLSVEPATDSGGKQILVIREVMALGWVQPLPK